MNEKTFTVKSIMAGVCISMGGCIYLKIGGAVGAILFAFGLIAVVTLGLNLFTGKAQFVWGRAEEGQFRQGGYVWLTAILALNLVGCLIMALLFSTPDLQEKASGIISLRLASPAWRNALLSVGCGFIMTLAVQNAVKKQWLPLLFGIPAFIICGLPHCIADAFYIASLPLEFITLNASSIALFYVSIVLGNFVGCNLYRAFSNKSH